MDLTPITTAVVDIIEEVVNDVAPSDLGIVTFFCNEAEKIEKVVEDIINKEPIPVQPPTSPVLTENLYPFSPTNKRRSSSAPNPKSTIEKFSLFADYIKNKN